MLHKELLDRFESHREAASEFGVSPSDISHWKVRGIPARYWLAAEAISKKRKWPYSAISLATTKPKAA